MCYICVAEVPTLATVYKTWPHLGLLIWYMMCLCACVNHSSGKVPWYPDLFDRGASITDIAHVSWHHNADIHHTSGESIKDECIWPLMPEFITWTVDWTMCPTELWENPHLWSFDMKQLGLFEFLSHCQEHVDQVLLSHALCSVVRDKKAGFNCSIWRSRMNPDHRNVVPTVGGTQYSRTCITKPASGLGKHGSVALMT